MHRVFMESDVVHIASANVVKRMQRVTLRQMEPANHTRIRPLVDLPREGRKIVQLDCNL